MISLFRSNYFDFELIHTGLVDGEVFSQAFSCSEDDYLVSVVGEDFDFEQSTAVINVAVLPAMFMRPQPIPEQEEDGWSQLMETAESLTNKYHQLRALFENLGRLELLN